MSNHIVKAPPTAVQQRQNLLQRWRRLPIQPASKPALIRLDREPRIIPNGYSLRIVEKGYYHYEYRKEFWLVLEDEA